MNYLKRKRDIATQCKVYRDQISLNLYRIDVAPNFLSGNKLSCFIKKTNKENKYLYYNIHYLQCRGKDEIVLSMNPK